MDNRLKRSLCTLGLLSILITSTSSGRRDILKENLNSTYNVLYDQMHYDSPEENKFYNSKISDINDTYSNALLDTLELPDMNRYVPQGLTIINDKILVSAYDYFGSCNSRIYVLDMNGKLLNTCSLDIIAHVGGISYDQDHDLIWVANTKGKVNAYKPYNILNKSHANSFYEDLDLGHDLINYRNDPAISYLTYYDNRLYVGNFTNDRNGTLKEYGIKINKDRSVSLRLKNRYSVPSMVQGISFYDYNDNRYIIFSRSHGLNTPSLLQIYKFDNNTLEYNESDDNCVIYETPSMMEQVVTYDNELYSLYESGSIPYSSLSVDSNNSIFVTDIDTLVLKNKRY